jgi:hypothetical protein
MNDLLAITRPFSLEVLVCLVMVLSMAVGVVCIGGYCLLTALSRLSLLAAESKTSGAASNHPPHLSAKAKWKTPTGRNRCPDLIQHEPVNRFRDYGTRCSADCTLAITTSGNAGFGRKA